MVAPSKLYHWPINRVHCSQILLHPGATCFEFFLMNCLQNSLSASKYLLPLIITPFISKIKNLDRQLVKYTLKYYVESALWPSFATALAFFFVCLFRNYFGKFIKYTTIFIPTLCGLQLVWFFPQRSLRLFSIATSQAALETALNDFQNPFTHIIRHSIITQALIFMVSSSMILHFKRKRAFNGFWFIQPIPQNSKMPVENNLEPLENETIARTKCEHHKGILCRRFILDGMKSYLMYGIPLDLLNMILKGRMPKGNKGFWNIFVAKMKTLRFNMTGFFLSYVGIYRLTSCLLSNYSTMKSGNLQNLISAFIGGISYICLGKISICTLSVVLAVQATWQYVCNIPRSSTRRYYILDLLKSVPFAKILVPLNVAYTAHCCIFKKDIVSGIGQGYLNAYTNNKVQHVYKELLSYDLETLLQEASKKTPKRIF